MHPILILTLDLKLSKEDKEKKKGPTDGRTDRQTGGQKNRKMTDQFL
jgi:hypothetical protein